jgi:hypothetical protein
MTLARHYVRFPRAASRPWSVPALCAAYQFPTGVTGPGATIGIVELGGGYRPSDITAAFARWNLPAPVLTDVGVSGGTNSPGDDADVEVVLDIEIAAAAYSYCTGKPARVRVYFAPNSDAGFLAAVRKAAADGCATVSISWGCYDENTEVLTKDGWRFFSEIRGDELVATLNPATGELEYQGISRVHKYPYKGHLHAHRGRCTDLVVTPNHNMYVRRGNRPAALVASEQVFDDNRCYVPKTAKWVGEEVKAVEVAGHQIDADLYLEFLGYFLSEGWASVGTTRHKSRVFIREGRRLLRRRRAADGSFLPAESGDQREDFRHEYTAKAFDETTYTVGIAQVKEGGVARIQRCLDRLPFNFVRTGHHWQCRNAALCESLVGFGKANEKHVPSWVKQLGPRQLRIFYDAMMLGDGTRGPRGKQAYYTSSWKLADDMQEVVLKLGYVGSIRTIDRRGRTNAKGTTRSIEYRVNIKEKYKTERITKRELVPYDGFVYCLTVPNHILYVRRNGMPAWCGNSSEDSWGKAACQSFDAACADAAARGSVVFAASGDNLSDDGDGDGGQPDCDFPASSPHVVGCGGTAKTATAEVVWNQGGGGTGGGYSAYFPAQPWQVGVPAGPGRMVPDVAADADPATGYEIYVDGGWTVVGGTSAVAPLYAGLFAAITSAAAAAGRPKLGNILPFLYTHPACFADVTKGDNGAWRAGVGPDPCTGLGVPNGKALLDAVIGTVSPPAPPPPPPNPVPPPAPPQPPSPPEPVPVTQILTGVVKIPLFGDCKMTGVITPAPGPAAGANLMAPGIGIPQPVLDLLDRYGKAVGMVLLADLPAVLFFKTKTWSDVLKDMMQAVGLAA